MLAGNAVKPRKQRVALFTAGSGVFWARKPPFVFLFHLWVTSVELT
jgi:hypothetical protein